MNKKAMKIISISMLAICIIISCGSVFAAQDVRPGEINGKINTSEMQEGISKIGKVGSTIAAIIRNVGIILAVIILMILGIKYMMGSASEKAEYKKTMIPYVVGAVVLFGAAGIAQAVISLAGGITVTYI